MNHLYVHSWSRLLQAVKNDLVFLQHYKRFVPLFFIAGMLFTSNAAGQEINFSSAVIRTVHAEKDLTAMPLRVLQEEVRKRTGLQLVVQNKVNGRLQPQIILVAESDAKLLSPAQQKLLQDLPATGKDGFKLVLDAATKLLIISGRDARSLLYGVGRLLRKMNLTTGYAGIPESITISTTPQYPIRGHQLGYRPKTNSYDAFSVAQFDQYIRELALFGANSIEIVPPRTDDDATSRHMKLPPLKMIAEQSRICQYYGLDVWMWYPNMGADYQDRKTVAEELTERETVFAAVKKLDALFVPGGDPGELDPPTLFAWLEKEAAVLKKYHPEAKIWVSPQVFRPTKKWMTSFYEFVNRKYNWFGGVVFGPWISTPVDSIRKMIDPSIPIRIYPDITHSLSSQYPVPDWDLAYAMTLGRECINPRPVDEKHIHNQFARYASGSISYSEGTNDDVNKFIWSAQDWDTTTTVTETLQDYSRLFIGQQFTKEMTAGLFGLENNLRGPLLSNSSVLRTLDLFQQLEKKIAPLMRRNFRFQMCLLRASYDAFIQKRLIKETLVEKNAYSLLRTASAIGSLAAISSADSLLNAPAGEWLHDPLRNRCNALADSLYVSIGAQLTIARHGATAGRGNFIDNIDVPLNDAPWMIDQLHHIAKLKDDNERLIAIHAMIERTNPGPGGIYTNFGTPEAKGNVLPGPGWNEDPGGLLSPMVNFGVGTRDDEWVHEILPKGFGGMIVPKAWMTQTGTLYQTPLRIKYDQLDTAASYRIRITYSGRFRSSIKLSANGILVHDFFQTGDKPIYEFEVPPAAVATGHIVFTFECPEGEQGAQVSEIWLLKTK